MAMRDDWDALGDQAWHTRPTVRVDRTDPDTTRVTAYYPVWEELFHTAWLLAKRADAESNAAASLSGLDAALRRVVEVRWSASAILLALTAAEAYINACWDAAGRGGNYIDPELWREVSSKWKPWTVDKKWLVWVNANAGVDVLAKGEPPISELEAMRVSRNRIAHHWPLSFQVDEFPAPPRGRAVKVVLEPAEYLAKAVAHIRQQGISAEFAARACNILIELVARLKEYQKDAPPFFGDKGPPRL